MIYINGIIEYLWLSELFYIRCFTVFLNDINYRIEYRILNSTRVPDLVLPRDAAIAAGQRRRARKVETTIVSSARRFRSRNASRSPSPNPHRYVFSISTSVVSFIRPCTSLLRLETFPVY